MNSKCDVDRSIEELIKESKVFVSEIYEADADETTNTSTDEVPV